MSCTRTGRVEVEKHSNTTNCYQIIKSVFTDPWVNKKETL